MDDASVSPINAKYMHSVYLRLGQIYLDEKLYQEAKDVFLESCNNEIPTVQTWLGIGKACYYQVKYEEAEDALAEANMLDQRHPDVWALLSAVCLQQIKRKPQVSRKEEANKAISMQLRWAVAIVNYCANFIVYSP